MKRRMLGPLVLMTALGCVAAACNGPVEQNCQRFDALSLTRDNNFSARLDWNSTRSIDLPVERIEVALTAIRPMKGPIELVHLVGDTEADHWTLSVPDLGNSPTSLCTIAPAGTTPTCGASLLNLPFSPAGYYYLRAGDNTVLEAGLAFYLCN